MIGIVISLSVIVLIGIGFLVWRRSRNRKYANTTTATSTHDVRPYLQEKGELEAEEKGRYELEGKSLVHEMSQGDDRFEMGEG